MIVEVMIMVKIITSVNMVKMRIIPRTVAFVMRKMKVILCKRRQRDMFVYLDTSVSHVPVFWMEMLGS